MLLKIRFFILCLFCSLPLFSEAEYDIIALQPADYVPSKDKTFLTTPKDLSRTGFVTGIWEEYRFKRADHEGEVDISMGSFVYHKLLGYQNIDIPGATLVTAEKVNINGIVGGTCFTTENCFFLYDSVNQAVTYLEPMAVSGVEFDCEIYAITIDGKMLLRNTWQNEPWEADLSPPEDQKVLKLTNGTIAFNNQADTITRDEFIPRFGEREPFGSLDPNGRYDWILPQVLSDTGVVAGCAFDSRGRQMGFIWDTEKGLRSFSNLGGDNVETTAINTLSQVVGRGHNKKDQPRAFYYDEESGLINLGMLKGHNYSEAYDINDQSCVVGLSTDYADEAKDRAFIWDKQRGLRDLSLLIPRESGWKCLNRADQINPEGYIIGRGDGHCGGFLLIPKN